MLRELTGSIFRWLFGIGLFGVSGWAATTGYENNRLTLMVSAVPLFALGIIVIWKPLFNFLTRPLLMLVDSIFFPGGKLAKPILNLKLPAFYINETRYTEALDEYRKILKYYPDEPEAYEKAIWLYSEIFEEPGEAAKLVRKAKKRNLSLDERVVRSLQI